MGECFGGYDLGPIAAEETRNTGAGAGPFVLFTATSRVKPSVGLQGRLGVFIAQSASLEAGIQFARPTLSSRLSDDAESAPDVTATETLTSLVVDGSLVLHLSGLSFAGGKGVPFVRGGAGYIRELHEKNEVVETGREYHAGAGTARLVWTGQTPCWPQDRFRHLRAQRRRGHRRCDAHGSDSRRVCPHNLF